MYVPGTRSRFHVPEDTVVGSLTAASRCLPWKLLYVHLYSTLYTFYHTLLDPMYVNGRSLRGLEDHMPFTLRNTPCTLHPTPHTPHPTLHRASRCEIEPLPYRFVYMYYMFLYICIMYTSLYMFEHSFVIFICVNIDYIYTWIYM